MEKYLAGLIDRMLDKSDENMIPYVSSATISWKAYREAEKLDSPEYIPCLIEFIDNETEKKKRESAYFILGHIARNTRHENAVEYLVSRIDKEQDKYVLASLLDRLQYLSKPAGMDIAPIITAIASKVWQIRYNAIQALKGTKNNAVEKVLITIITKSRDEFDLLYANTILSNIGTRESIPHLLRLLEHKKQHVSGSALYAILALSEKSDLPVFIEQLEKSKNKFPALLGVIKQGDKTVIPCIVKRVKQLLNKKRAVLVTDVQNQTEIILAMNFLSNYTHESEEPQKLYALLTKKQDLLWDNEKKWLDENKIKFEEEATGNNENNWS